LNANELADELDSISYDCTIEEWRASPVGSAATMLRQQQAEIEALKGDGKVCARCGAIAYDPVITQTAKTLTDEEIENIAYKVFEVGDGKEALFNFARAILRKAQEK